MSSIYRRGGYYVYQRYVYNPTSGYYDKRIYESLGKDVKSEDIPILKKQLDEKYNRERVKERISPTYYLSYCIKIYLEQKQLEVDQNRRSINTLRTDKNSLDLFSLYMKENYGDIDIKKISRKHINRWKESRFSEDQVKSPTTVAVNLRTVRSFFSYMRKTERIESNPFEFVDIPKSTKRKDENITEIFDALYTFISKEINKREQTPLDKLPKRINNKKEGLEWFHDNEWFIHYLWIMLNTGMRSGEVSILKWKKDITDVGDEHSRSYVYISDDPSEFVIFFKRRKRKIPILPPVAKSLTTLKKSSADSTYVFENDKTKRPHHTSTIGKLFKKLVQDEDLKLDDEHTPHSIRHGYGSFLLNNGATVYKVSRLLGHSTKEITEYYYTHSESQDVSETMGILYQ